MSDLRRARKKGLGKVRFRRDDQRGERKVLQIGKESTSEGEKGVLRIRIQKIRRGETQDAQR